MAAHQQIEDFEQERAAAAGDVGKAHSGDVGGRLALDGLAHGIGDDVADDVFGRVINAARLADFRLFHHPRAIGDDFAQEPFVNAAQNVDRDGRPVPRK